MIGGDFQIAPCLLASDPVPDNVLRFIGPNDVLVDSGRSAIRLALKSALEGRRFRCAWIPLYSCRTMVEPFLETGLEIKFYGMGEDLAQPTGLPDRLNDCLILFVHYFGRYNYSMASYLESCKFENTIVLEDVVQSCMNKNHGHLGDYVIHSLRKFLPVPDGAVVTGVNPNIKISSPANEAFISKTLISKLIRLIATGQETRHLEIKSEAENLIGKAYSPRKISEFSKYLLERLDLKKVQKQRQQNWAKLDQLFKSGVVKDGSIRQFYQDFDSGDVPLTFPVLASEENRGEIVRSLAKSGVYCPVHWDLSYHPCSIYEQDLKLSRRIFSIPIDQRITRLDMEYLFQQLAQL